MDSVREWVRTHLDILRVVTWQDVTELDFTDDRLALILKKISFTGTWRKIEHNQCRHLLRVYGLGEEKLIRLDATTGKVYHSPENHVIFQVGKAKNGQYETQYKLMLASQDPLGLALAMDVVPGHKADDPLYLPIYQRVKNNLQRDGLLLVGNSKMSAVKTRAFIEAGNDFYLMPQKKDNELLDTLLAPWAGREDEMEYVCFPEESENPKEDSAIAYGFEITRIEEFDIGGRMIEWEERLIVARSEQYAKSIKKGLENRLDKAEAKLKKLTPPVGRGKDQLRDEASLLASVEKIEKKHRVKGLFLYEYEKEIIEKKVRGYKGKPARRETKVRFQLSVKRNQGAIAKAENRAGWRIYLSNAPEEELPFKKAVLAYRNQYIAENIFRRLKGEIISMNPLYVQRDDHAKGLFHLLTLAAQVMAVGDYLAKIALANENTKLAGLYPGNPKRSTATPTTERMLEAFGNINLVIIPVGEEIRYQVTPLTGVLKTQ
jgi:transposase